MCEDIHIKEFEEHLDHDDQQVQVYAIKRLSSIAAAVGVNATQQYLLPMICQKLERELHEEVLMNLSEALLDFLPLVGGPEHVAHLMPVFEKLLNVDDNYVREKVVCVLKYIAGNLTDEQFENIILPIIIRLAQGDWFSGKCSSTGLFGICYPKVNAALKESLRILYREIIQDDSPIVRRNAAANLVEFVQVLEKEYLKLEFVPVFDNLANDDQDSVRVLAINVGVSVASRLTESETEEYVLQKLLGLGADVSWRVRYRFANQINDLQETLGPDFTRKYLVPVIQSLSKDIECQIREEIARNVVTFCEKLQESYNNNSEEIKDPIDPVITSIFFGIIKELEQDINETVVEELYVVLSSMGQLLGPGYSKTFLLPLYSAKIESCSHKVKESVVSNINQLIKVVGFPELADGMQGTVMDLKNSSIWRTRRNLFVTLSHIIQHVDSEHFNDYYLSVYIELLHDPVAAVRRTGTLVFPILLKKFGVQWAHGCLVPILALYLQERYNYMYVILFGIDEIVTPLLDKSKENVLEICSESANYNMLNYFYATNFKDTEDFHIKQLNSIAIMASILNEQLQNEWVQETLQINESKEYFNDDILTYAEYVEQELRNENKPEQNANYLETTLKLILTTFLALVQKLAEHKVINVRLRAANTLENIKSFSKQLQNSLNDIRIKNILALLPEEDNIKEKLQIEEYLETYSFKLGDIDESEIAVKMQEDLHIHAEIDSIKQETEETVEKRKEDNENILDVLGEEMEGTEQEILIFDCAVPEDTMDV